MIREACWKQKYSPRPIYCGVGLAGANLLLGEEPGLA